VSLSVWREQSVDDFAGADECEVRPHFALVIDRFSGAIATLVGIRPSKDLAKQVLSASEKRLFPHELSCGCRVPRTLDTMLYSVRRTVLGRIPIRYVKVAGLPKHWAAKTMKE
jgi:hypothetical protein